MKITITPTDGTAFTLCAGEARATDGSAAGPMDLSGGKAPGTVDREYIGAAGVAPEGVGCDRVMLSFGVMKTFTTAALASAAAAGLKAAVPAVGAVTIDESAYMAMARCTYSFGQAGCSLSIKYSLEGY
jgi:hypothetical protein